MAANFEHKLGHDTTGMPIFIMFKLSKLNFLLSAVDFLKIAPESQVSQNFQC